MPSNTTLDHLAIIAPSIQEGVAWVEEALGVTPPEGGRHPLMGTRNHLMQIGGGRFLEIMAIDEAAAPPGRPRWFGLDDARALHEHWAAGRRLRGYVARTSDLAGAIEAAGPGFGLPVELTRGDLRWHFGVTADGSLPLGGAAPYLIDWGVAGSPAGRMADFGIQLRQLVVETPDPVSARAACSRLGFSDPPLFRPGVATRLFAVLDTPSGPRLLA